MSLPLSFFLPFCLFFPPSLSLWHWHWIWVWHWHWIPFDYHQFCWNSMRRSLLCLCRFNLSVQLKSRKEKQSWTKAETSEIYSTDNQLNHAHDEHSAWAKKWQQENVSSESFERLCARHITWCCWWCSAAQQYRLNAPLAFVSNQQQVVSKWLFCVSVCMCVQFVKCSVDSMSQSKCSQL